jgi:ribonuclease E
MKENTAAIHCQVPVDVAAFLLNEKRSEVIKIETRSKVNVLMIPNKYLETPHYKLERLRHDDPRLDQVKASYAFAEEVAKEMEEDTIVSKSAQAVQPRQVAAVRGITPSQPAPVNQRQESLRADAASSAAQSTGFMGFLKRLFGGSESTPTPTPVVVETPKPSERPARKNSQRRGRPHHDRQNDAAQKKSDQPTDAASPSVAPSSTPADQSAKPRRGRNQRPEVDKSEDAQGVQSADVSSSSVETKEVSDEKRRSRNRRNRNRNKDRAERTDQTPADATQNNDVTVSVDSASPAIIASDAAPSVRPTPVDQVVNMTPTAPVAPVVINPRVATPLPRVAMQELHREPLDIVLAQVGLVWVDTNPQRHQEVLRQIAEQPKPLHVPRVPKPAAPPLEGPMILVETGGAERVVH